MNRRNVIIAVILFWVIIALVFFGCSNNPIGQDVKSKTVQCVCDTILVSDTAVVPQRPCWLCHDRYKPDTTKPAKDKFYKIAEIIEKDKSFTIDSIITWVDSADIEPACNSCHGWDPICQCIPPENNG